MLTFLVHQEIGDPNGTCHYNLARSAPHALFFDLPQYGQGQIVIGPDQASAVTMRAALCCGLYHPGTQPLPAHFHQAKAGNAPNLNPRTICFQLVFDPLFNREIVFAFIHIDKVDNDQTGKITQTHLARHFFGGLKIRFQSRFFD